MSVVIDASAVLAVLNGELGTERIEAMPVGGLVSATNVSEVLSKLVDVGLDDNAAIHAFDALMLTVVPVDAAQAQYAGLLRRQTREHGLSLGDHACLALAASLQCPAVTADRAWAKLDLGIEIQLIR